jgi:uncharacterized membrane protein YccC
MHMESSSPRHSSRAFVLRLVIAGLISLLILAVQLPNLPHPLDWSGALALTICVAPLIVIIAGVLSRHHGLETTGWGALLLVFLLRLFT